jgi:RND family efflux transporter MFP subunit
MKGKAMTRKNTSLNTEGGADKSARGGGASSPVNIEAPAQERPAQEAAPISAPASASAPNPASAEAVPAPRAGKSRRGRKIVTRLILAAVLILLAIAAVRVVSERLAPQEAATIPPINVRVAEAVRADLSGNSLITGRLEAVEEVSVVPKIPGEVTAVYVELGDKVAKGSTLFEMDRTQAATAVNQARIALNDAQTNYDRISFLYNEGAVAAQAYEQARSALSMARESYAAAGDAYGNSSVTAPISGYITQVNVAEGAMASQAVPAVGISNIDKLKIDTTLSEQMINKVRVGDTVGVLVKSVSEEPLSGTVTALSPAPAAGSLTYPVVISLDNADAAVKPGMFAEVVIETARAEGALAIPTRALMIKSGRQVVAVLEAGDQVVFQEVTTGVDDGEMIEILSGIGDGARIVVEGQAYLDESSQVNIVE